MVASIKSTKLRGVIIRPNIIIPTCNPFTIANYDWTLFPISGNTSFYNDPTKDGVSFNINLGGYAPAWTGTLIPNDPNGVYVNLMGTKTGSRTVDGGIYDPGTSDINLWGASNYFLINDTTVMARYNAVGGLPNGLSNPSPGHTEYPGVASYSAWSGNTYIQPKVYGQPVSCELWYSLNMARSNPLMGYNNYSFFGDFGGGSLPSISLGQPGAFIKKYFAGIFKADADMSNLSDSDYIMGLSYVGNAISGTSRVIQSGTVTAIQTWGSGTTYINGYIDCTFDDNTSLLDPLKSNCNNFELDSDQGYVAGDVGYPPSNNNGRFDTYQVKMAFYVDCDTALSPTVADTSSYLYWVPGMFYTLPNTPLLCAPASPQPSYSPA